MIEALALTVVASLAEWPSYTDTQWIHTDETFKYDMRVYKGFISKIRKALKK